MSTEQERIIQRGRSASEDGNVDYRLTTSILDHFIRLSSPCFTDRITIAGTQNIDLLIGLLRGGFMNVSCLAADRGLHVGDMPSDALWISAIATDNQLTSVLHQLGRTLRVDGLLLIQVKGEWANHCSPQLQRILTAHGVEVEIGFTAAGGDLFVRARRRKIIRALRAA
jgi:hypothetical protein